MVKKLLSAILSITTAVSLLTSFPATAGNTTKVPYSLSDGITKLKSNLSTKNDYLKAKSLLVDYRKAVSDYKDTEEQIANTANPVKKIRLQFELEKQEKVVNECALEVASRLGINSDSPNEMQLSISSMLSGHLDTKFGEFDYSFNSFFDWLWEIEPETIDDSDGDGLNDELEAEIGTDINSADTDGDSLKDGEEVDKYFTNPLEVDTDKDGLNDDDEIYFCTDPNDPDTDDNGILDGDEKRDQSFVYKAENKDSVVTEVFVSLNGTGNLQKNMQINSIMNKDRLCSNAVGLVGEPFSIETSSQFDEATLTFKIDKTKLGETDFNNLLFLWHDEENHEFVELDTIHDSENSTVSVNTTHFSKYLIVDKEEWYAAWAKKFNYNNADISGAPLVSYYTVLAIDCSGSMEWYDPISYENIDNTMQYTCERKKAAEGFINVMNPNDKSAILLFTGYVENSPKLTNNKDDLKAALEEISSDGGTDFDVAINKSIEILDSENKNYTTKRILLLSDGESYVSDNTIDNAKKKSIHIYTVGLGADSGDETLKRISEETGGKFYKAFTAEKLVAIYEEFGISGDFDTTDDDYDKLYDAVEIAGIRLENGEIINTDPTKPDSDGDGFKDGEEIDPKVGCRYNNSLKQYYFVMNSDPNNLNDTPPVPTAPPIDPDPLQDETESSYFAYVSANSATLRKEPNADSRNLLPSSLSYEYAHIIKIDNEVDDTNNVKSEHGNYVRKWGHTTYEYNGKSYEGYICLDNLTKVEYPSNVDKEEFILLCNCIAQEAGQTTNDEIDQMFICSVVYNRLSHDIKTYGKWDEKSYTFYNADDEDAAKHPNNKIYKVINYNDEFNNHKSYINYQYEHPDFPYTNKVTAAVIKAVIKFYNEKSVEYTDYDYHFFITKDTKDANGKKISEVYFSPHHPEKGEAALKYYCPSTDTWAEVRANINSGAQEFVN